jgi:alanine dehydrogenase
MVPGGVKQLTARGHQVLVQKGAGLGSGFDDDAFAKAGAELVGSAAEVYKRAEMIVKVKEPLDAEYPLIHPGQLLFTYFHFAASRKLTQAMIKSGATCIAYETIEDAHGRLPLLTPMSEVAGRMAVQIGAYYLQKPEGGRGVLLGGVPGVPPAEVAILGGGVVGTQAAWMAAGLGAWVTILDVNLERLRYLADVMPPNVTTLHSNPDSVLGACRRADLVVGAVLVPGASAPRLVPRSYLQHMKPGSVIVDVAVDQGGCVETCKPTTHSKPTFVVDGVVHYCVANMPGAVPRTSTYALTNATIPYALRLADRGLTRDVLEDRGFALGINIMNGKVTLKAVADAFRLKYEPLGNVLGA